MINAASQKTTFEEQLRRFRNGSLTRPESITGFLKRFMNTPVSDMLVRTAYQDMTVRKTNEILECCADKPADSITFLDAAGFIVNNSNPEMAEPAEKVCRLIRSVISFAEDETRMTVQRAADKRRAFARARNTCGAMIEVVRLPYDDYLNYLSGSNMPERIRKRARHFLDTYNSFSYEKRSIWETLMRENTGKMYIDDIEVTVSEDEIYCGPGKEQNVEEDSEFSPAERGDSSPDERMRDERTKLFILEPMLAAAALER